MKAFDDQWPQKAYKNMNFLNSHDARPVRVLSEFLEPAARLRKYRIHDTIVFFGSARVREPAHAKRMLEDLKQVYKDKKKNRKVEQKIKQAQAMVKMSKFYEDARRLAHLLTEWSISLGRGKRRFIVCSGGGPGIMEAANRGATEGGGGYSLGFNISIPHEQTSNPFITRELNFEFHYFFIRKYWFLYLAKALVVFPGGFGTFDELFEILTLIQTEKVKKKIPVLIFGSSYWKKTINFPFMVEQGVISQEDLNLFHFSDDPVEAFEYLKGKLSTLYLNEK